LGGILAGKLCGMNGYYLGFGGRGLTRFPQRGAKVHARDFSPFGPREFRNCRLMMYAIKKLKYDIDIYQ
jgi:hypothetical protein